MLAVMLQNSAQINSEAENKKLKKIIEILKDSTFWSVWLNFFFFCAIRHGGATQPVTGNLQLVSYSPPFLQTSLAHGMLSSDNDKSSVLRIATADITQLQGHFLAGLYKHVSVRPRRFFLFCFFFSFQRKHPCSVAHGQVQRGDGGPIFRPAALVRRLTGTQIAGIDFF